MSIGLVDFSSNSKVIFSVIKKGGTLGTANLDQLVLYQRYEYGSLAASSRISTAGGGTFGPAPEYIAVDSDNNTGLRVGLPNNLVTVRGGLVYVTEVFSQQQRITPLDNFGVTVPKPSTRSRTSRLGVRLTDMTRERVTSIHGSDQRGFALIYIALIMTLLLLFAGLAVDSGRAYMVKAQLTKAVDGAALGAARMLNSANPRNQAVQLFNANFPSGYFNTNGGDPTAAANFFTLTTDEANAVNVVTVTATTNMPTTFMSLGNITDVPVKATAEATRRMVDLCLVLDTSGSLGFRWPAVRDAARAFVNAFDENNDRFCLVRYSSGAPVLQQMTAGREFDKTAAMNAIPQALPGGFTAMAEGLHHGWDELRTVPSGQQSSLRIIVLFTDGAANNVPGIYDTSPGSAKGLATSDFPDNAPDPDNMTRNNPSFMGLYDTDTEVRNPSFGQNVFWNSTFTHPAVPYLPLTSFHAHTRSGGIPTQFPLQTNMLTVGGAPQDAVRGLRNFDFGAGRYPADVFNTNNAARNLVEIIADAARSDLGGDYRIRIFTIGMGELLRYWVGTMPEQPETILQRVANDVGSPDHNSAQITGKYYYAATEADVGPAFQELQNQIIRLTK